MSITTAIALEHISNADHVPRRTWSNARPTCRLQQTHLLVLTRGTQFDSDDLLRSEACGSLSCTSQMPQLTSCLGGLQCSQCGLQGQSRGKLLSYLSKPV